jgi:cyclopropane-fatty-acyl-phospholipid synthase
MKRSQKPSAERGRSNSARRRQRSEDKHFAPISLRQHLLEHLKRRLADDPQPLRVVFWDGEMFDFACPPTVILTMRSPAVGRMFASGNIARLGDAYVAGELSVEGSVPDILRVGIALAERIERLPMISPIGPLHWVTRRNSRDRDTANIKHHYDVSNEFYRLWLDHELIIDTAQRQKLDHVCRKLRLRLRPGDHVLDIGCGWGGLLRWAAMHYGVTAVGVTLSERQYQFASERISNQKLAGWRSGARTTGTSSGPTRSTKSSPWACTSMWV